MVLDVGYGPAERMRLPAEHDLAARVVDDVATGSDLTDA